MTLHTLVIIALVFCALSAVGKVLFAFSGSPDNAETHRQQAYNEAIIAADALDRKTVEHHTSAAYAHMLAAELKENRG